MEDGEWEMGAGSWGMGVGEWKFGSGVDREVLISCKMLKRWDLLHETFPHETVGQYVKRKLKLQKVAYVYNKSAIPSKVRVNTVPPECQKLRNKILTKHADIIKDKIG